MRLIEWVKRRRGRLSRPQPEVDGERAPMSLASVLSVQARATNLLALGLMTAFGTGALAWYYVRAAQRPSVTPQPASRAQTEMALPPLGPITGPAQARAPTGAPAVSTPAAAAAAPTPMDATTPVTAPELRRALSPTLGSEAAAAPPAAPSPFQRRLSGSVFASAAIMPGTPASTSTLPTAASGATEPQRGELSALLGDAAPAAVRAKLLGDQRLLLPKGAFIDCTLETAIDSSLPGMTTCITATDTFSTDGSVVLLERGTKLVGETRGQVRQGAARLFVLWTEARTPTGVIVPLDSPGTDELGRSGLAGEIDRHFWQRFGAALLITTIDGAVQAAIQSGRQSGGTVIYNTSGAENMATEALRSTVDLPPTLTKRNGDRIQVLVARDIDFSAVYELRHAGGS